MPGTLPITLPAVIGHEGAGVVEEVGDLCNPDDSAGLLLIETRVQACQQPGVGVNVRRRRWSRRFSAL